LSIFDRDSQIAVGFNERFASHVVSLAARCHFGISRKFAKKIIVVCWRGPEHEFKTVPGRGAGEEAVHAQGRGASLAAASPEKTDEPPRISSVGPNRHLNVCVPGTYFFPQRTIASSTSPSALPFSVRV